jgi:hypothetical protein
MVYKVKLLRWKRQRKVLLLKEWNLTKSKDLLKSVEIKKVRKPLKQLATLLPTLLLTWLNKKLFMKSFHMLLMLKSNTYQNLFHQEISLRKKLDLKAKLRLSNPHKIKQNLLRMVTLLLKKHQLELLLPLFPIVINLRKLQNLKLTRQCKNSQVQVNLDQLLWKPRKLTERSFMTYKKLLMMVEFHQET